MSASGFEGGKTAQGKNIRLMVVAKRSNEEFFNISANLDLAELPLR
jgi:hypothetical protein